MITKKVTMYECEFCGKESDSKQAIIVCENNHKELLEYSSKQSKWGQEVIKDSGRKCYEDALELLRQSDNVVLITESDETGELINIIAPDADTEFWLSAYETREEAEALCKEMGWKYD